MKFKNVLKYFASSAVMLMVSGAAAYAQAVVTFDNVVAPQFYFQVTSGGPDGPTFTAPDVTFTGGVVLNGTNFYGPSTPNPATSGTNFYSTAFPNTHVPAPNNNEIDNGTTPLPGAITGQLAVPGKFTNISLDIIDGMPFAGTVTFTAFDALNNIIATNTINTVGIFNDPGLTQEVTHVSLSGSGIDHFKLTSPNNNPNQEAAFAIDTVTLSTPEPSTVAGLMIGAMILAGMIAIRRRSATASSTD